MSKNEILRLASEYEAFMALIIKAAAKRDEYYSVLSVWNIKYKETGIQVILHRPGFSSVSEILELTYEELEKA